MSLCYPGIDTVRKQTQLTKAGCPWVLQRMSGVME
jgi:hypothetical protein